MPQKEFAEQSLIQGTPLLRELSRIMEQDMASESLGREVEKADGLDGKSTTRTVASFVGKQLESSRRSGAMSMLYSGHKL